MGLRRCWEYRRQRWLVFIALKGKYALLQCHAALLTFAFVLAIGWMPRPDGKKVVCDSDDGQKRGVFSLGRLSCGVGGGDGT